MSAHHVATTFAARAVHVCHDDIFAKRIAGQSGSHAGLVVRMREHSHDLSLELGGALLGCCTSCVGGPPGLGQHEQHQHNRSGNPETWKSHRMADWKHAM